MKKITILVIAIFGVLTFGLSANAQVIYQRTPSGFEVVSPINFKVSIEYYEALGCGPNNYWAVEVKSVWYEPVYRSIFLTSTSENLDDDIDLPVNDYRRVYPICCDDEIGSNCSAGNMLEFNNDEVIFSVVEEGPPPPKPEKLFTLTAGGINEMLSYIGGIFGSIGGIVFLVIGILLAFYVIPEAIELIKLRKEKEK